MATSRELRRVLLEKLGVTPQRLSQLAKARKNKLPMSTELAIYTIAHERGVDISKYLDLETTREVRQLVTQLKATSGRNGDLGGTKTRPSGNSATRSRPVSISIGDMNIGNVPGLKRSHAQEAKTMAERVYPVLYLFENSVRDFIERVLLDKYGKNWWEAAVAKKVRDKADQFKVDEAKDTWHGKRGRRDLDYLLLTELWKIIRDKWKDFEPFFPQGPAWVQSLIESDMNVSRRVIAHMNPLAEDDIKGLEASFRKWVRYLAAVEGKLP